MGARRALLADFEAFHSPPFRSRQSASPAAKAWRKSHLQGHLAATPRLSQIPPVGPPVIHYEKGLKEVPSPSLSIAIQASFLFHSVAGFACSQGFQVSE